MSKILFLASSLHFGLWTHGTLESKCGACFERKLLSCFPSSEKRNRRWEAQSTVWVLLCNLQKFWKLRKDGPHRQELLFPAFKSSFTNLRLLPGFLLFCSFIRSLELKQLFQRFARFGMALSFLLGSLAGQSFPDQLSFKLYWSLCELPLCALSAGHSLWPALGLAAFTLDNPFERTDLKHFLFGRSHGSRGLIRNRVFVTFDGQLLPLIS